LPSSRDIADSDGAARSNRELAVAAALLERGMLGRRLHNGPLQDIAATMLQLQILAERADPANRSAFEDAIAILVDQQRTIREMVESMLAGELGTKVAIATVLDAVAMQWRQAGRKLTWTVAPSEAMLTARDDLAFRLRLLETLGAIVAPAVAVEVRAVDTVDVAISGPSIQTVQFSIEVAA
jgi:signal transduction histidine kinase